MCFLLPQRLAKEFDQHKQDGDTDENAADILAYEGYSFICKEFFERGMFLSLAWLVFAWNNLCRHDNVKTASFHNLTTSHDFIRTKFDRTKTTGSTTSKESNPKHCFANPLKPWTCMNFTLGELECRVSCVFLRLPLHSTKHLASACHINMTQLKQPCTALPQDYGSPSEREPRTGYSLGKMLAGMSSSEILIKF